MRTAVPEDLPELQRVFRVSSLSNAGDRDALLAHPEHLMFVGSGIAAGRTMVAQVDDRLVGFASTIEIDSDQAELEDLFVDPAWQRQGTARQLVGALVDNGRRRGLRTILVTGNPHALPFYLAVGFVVIGEQATELGTGTRLALDLS